MIENLHEENSEALYTYEKKFQIILEEEKRTFNNNFETLVE